MASDCNQDMQNSRVCNSLPGYSDLAALWFLTECTYHAELLLAVNGLWCTLHNFCHMASS